MIGSGNGARGDSRCCFVRLLESFALLAIIFCLLSKQFIMATASTSKRSSGGSGGNESPPKKQKESPSKLPSPSKFNRKTKVSPAAAKTGGNNSVNKVYVISVYGHIFVGWTVHALYPNTPAYTGDTEYQLVQNTAMMDQYNITTISQRSDPNNYGHELYAYRRNQDQTINENARITYPAFIKVSTERNDTPTMRAAWGRGLTAVFNHFGRQNRFKEIHFEFGGDLTDPSRMTYLGDHVVWRETARIGMLIYDGVDDLLGLFSDPGTTQQLFGPDRAALAVNLYRSSTMFQAVGNRAVELEQEEQPAVPDLGIERFD